MPEQIFHEQTWSDELFIKFAHFIKANCGININLTKKDIIFGKIHKRMVALKIKSAKSYWEYLQNEQTINDYQEIWNLFDLITTKETFFQRYPEHFEILQTRVLPELIENEKKNITIWSSGCSTGEEPYDIAMSLLEYINENKSYVTGSIIATDISDKVLENAKIGQYPDRRIAKLSDKKSKKFFTETSPEKSPYPFAKRVLEINPDVKKWVTFSRHNLIQDEFYQGIDIIFCRNVFIYFDMETQKQIFYKFFNSLNKGGYLFLGPMESLHVTETIFNAIKINNCTIYQKPL